MQMALQEEREFLVYLETVQLFTTIVAEHFTAWPW